MNKSAIVLIFFISWSLAAHPGSRTKGCTWVDSEGDLWLFGGITNLADGVSRGHLNDLWKYDTKSLEWKWIRGNNDPSFVGNFGTKGVYNATNNPPSLIHPLCYQTQDEFRLVLGFGPSLYSGSGGLLDQWSYSPSINQWAWTFGNQQPYSMGVYVNRGFFTAASIPRPRAAPYLWQGADNLIYVYGGIAEDFSLIGDLWAFDPQQNMWAWIGGSSTVNVRSAPGTFGTSSVLNFPGSRYAGVNWVGPDGTFWMLGGTGYDQNGNWGVLNDVWRYNPLLNEWTWVGGTPVANTLANYGQLNQPSPNNVMGPRLAGGSWYDAANDLVYIFGGYGVNDVGSTGFLSDLWTYNPSTNEWLWISGTNAINSRASFGTYRVPSPTALPTSSFYPYSWMTNDTLWLYGGNWQDNPAYEFFTALWAYNLTSRQWTWMDGFQESNLLAVYPTIPPITKEPFSPPLTQNSTLPSIPMAISTDDSWFTSWQVFSSDVNLFNRRLLFGVGIAGVVIVDSIILVILACTGVIKIPSKE